jgi:hypothetical protein
MVQRIPDESFDPLTCFVAVNCTIDLDPLSSEDAFIRAKIYHLTVLVVAHGGIGPFGTVYSGRPPDVNPRPVNIGLVLKTGVPIPCTPSELNSIT